MAFKRTVTSREFSISRHQIWCAHAIATVVQRQHACARKLPSCYSLSKKLVTGAETIADNNNKTLEYIFPLLIFPLSYFPAHIPSTCLAIPVKQHKSEFLNFDCLPHFLGLHFWLRRQLSRRNVLQTRNSLGRPRLLNKFNITSRSSTCEHSGLQSWLVGRLTLKSVVLEGPKEFPKLLCLNVKNTSSSDSLSGKTTVWLLHMNWSISIF